MFTEFAREHNIIIEDTVILLAVSGGRDSMYMLDRAVREAAAARFSVCCAHFNHCLRGEESDSDELFVSEYCKSFGIPFFSGRGDVSAYADENGLGIEEAAREMRYAFLDETADKCSAKYIATAHNADDCAETILFNLARGSGLKGMCGIPPVRGRIIRPVLSVSRDEIDEYIRANSIPFVEDSSNSTDDYSRNRIRHGAVPVLKQINSAFSKNAVRTASLLRQDDEFLTGLALEFIEKHRIENSLSAAKLWALPRPVSSRVIRQMAESDLSLIHIESITNLCSPECTSGSSSIPGMIVSREFDRIYFGRTESEPINELVITPGSSVNIPGTDLAISCEILEYTDEIHSSLTTFCFKYSSICGSISLKSRNPGDKIRLRGRGCTKSLKKLFSEAKLRRSDRDTVPVISDDNGLLAVYGFGADERGTPSPGDMVYKIEIKHSN